VQESAAISRPVVSPPVEWSSCAVGPECGRLARWCSRRARCSRGVCSLRSVGYEGDCAYYAAIAVDGVGDYRTTRAPRGPWACAPCGALIGHYVHRCERPWLLPRVRKGSSWHLCLGSAAVFTNLGRTLHASLVRRHGPTLGLLLRQTPAVWWRQKPCVGLAAAPHAVALCMTTSRPSFCCEVLGWHRGCG